MTRRIHVGGYHVKNGKLEKIPGYKLNASARIAQSKSKKVRPVVRAPG